MQTKLVLLGALSIGLASLAVCLALGVEKGIVAYTLFLPTLWINVCALMNLRRM
jgi:hypothetical protein